MLTADVTNPLDTSAGVLAGQILALTLNREYSCADVFTYLGLTPPGMCLGDLVISDSCGKFGGLTQRTLHGEDHRRSALAGQVAQRAGARGRQKRARQFKFVDREVQAGGVERQVVLDGEGGFTVEGKSSCT